MSPLRPWSALLVVAAVVGVLAAPPLGEWTPTSSAAAQTAFKPHAAVKITHNNDFRAATAGVTQGHGTTSDPYIIEGWSFKASQGPAIWITGTSAYFVIRNCEFESDSIGIQLDDMSNGVITEARFTGNGVGIQISRASNIDAFKNTFEGNTQGAMVLIETGDVVVTQNVFRSNSVSDIQLNTTDKGRIENNQFDSKVAGVDFNQGANFKLLKNQFTTTSGLFGARIDGMDAGEIKENRFTGFRDYGLQMLRSNRGLVQANEFTQNGNASAGAGVLVQESSSMQLVANMANGNHGRGVYLVETSQSWIKDGQASGNGNDGIELRYSSNDGVRNMEVKDNARAGINLNESSNNLVESNTVTGNRIRNNGSIIVGGNDNKIVKNEVANNAGFGILITQWMSGNQLLANNVHNNGRDDIYSDADPNQNIISDEEIVQQDSPQGAAERGMLPAPPLAAVLGCLLLGTFLMRRRRA